MVDAVLSIIVPSYNISNYVDECLPSYVDDRLFEKIIIYLIDDGATDDTRTKVDSYLKKYPNLFRFIHKPNGGHGSVINFGILNLVATKYFKVIDGDDWVNTSELIRLVDYLYTTNDDVVVSGYSHSYPDKICHINPLIRTTSQLFLEKKSYGTSLLPNLNYTIHSVTYKSSIFSKNKILLPEKVLYEDNLFILYPLPYIKRASFIDANVYQYRLGNPVQSVSNESRIKHYDDSLIIKKCALSYYNKYYSTVDNDIKKTMNNIMAYGIINFKLVLLKFPDNNEARKELKKMYAEIKTSRELVKKVKTIRFNRLIIFVRFRFLNYFRKKI